MVQQNRGSKIICFSVERYPPLFGLKCCLSFMSSILFYHTLIQNFVFIRRQQKVTSLLKLLPVLYRFLKISFRFHWYLFIFIACFPFLMFTTLSLSFFSSLTVKKRHDALIYNSFFPSFTLIHYCIQYSLSLRMHYRKNKGKRKVTTEL